MPNTPSRIPQQALKDPIKQTHKGRFDSSAIEWLDNMNTGLLGLHVVKSTSKYLEIPQSNSKPKVSQMYPDISRSTSDVLRLISKCVQLSTSKSVRCNDKIYLTRWPLGIGRPFKSENEREELCYGNIQPRTQPIPMDLPYDWK